MKKSYRSMLLLMVIIIVAFTAACGNNAGNKNNGVTESPSPTEEAGENTPAEEAVNPFKFTEPVDVVFAKNIFDIKVYPEGEDPQNNAVYKMMKDIININATNKFAVPYENYKQRIKLGIASNDLPDVFFADQADLEELMKNDMLLDLKPIYEKYATENLKKIMGYGDNILFKGAQKGDAIYGMPSVSDALNGSPALYLNKKWMEKLGASTPTTMEQVLELAVRMTKEDPDGNGKADTYGLSMNNQLDLRYTAIMNAYGVYPKIYTKDADGKLTYGSLNPNMKQGLAKLAELYQANVFDKEFVTKDMGKSAELVSKGAVGIFMGEFFSPLWPLQDAVKNVAGTDYVGIPVPGLGGAEYKPFVPINASGFFVVRKDFKHPEALILLLNNLAETAYNNLDNEWAKAWMALSKDPKYANASINNWLPAFLDRPDANMNRYTLFKTALDTKDDTQMPADQKVTFDNVKKGLEGDAANWPWARTFLEGVPSASSYKTVIRDEWVGSPTETGKLKGASLKKLEDEMVMKIITGAEPVDYFDKFVKQFLEQGGQQILDEMNAALAAK
ncbi:hypothetical protein ACFO9Q_22240 [Paenibacillus sp. GCM10023252]|uniref:hypothetical protein n=1 Tax=Paenibacillus sp. GCM10023252 TaxID=3252649 RepID=UPI00361A2537